MPSFEGFGLALGLGFDLGFIFVGPGDGEGAPERWAGGIVLVWLGGEEDGWVGGVVQVGSLAAVSVIIGAIGAVPA